MVTVSNPGSLPIRLRNLLFDVCICLGCFENLLHSRRYGDRIVAIKVLNHGNNSEERTAPEGRFAREVTMMSIVKHENLVKASTLVIAF